MLLLVVAIELARESLLGFGDAACDEAEPEPVPMLGREIDGEPSGDERKAPVPVRLIESWGTIFSFSILISLLLVDSKLSFSSLTLSVPVPDPGLPNLRARGKVIEPFLPLKLKDPVPDALLGEFAPLPPKPHSSFGVDGKNDEDRLERVRGVPGTLVSAGEAPFDTGVLAIKDPLLLLLGEGDGDGRALSAPS